MREILIIVSALVFLNLNCITRYRGMPVQDVSHAIMHKTLFIQISYSNMNPDIDSFEMEPQVDRKVIGKIALQNNFNNIRFMDKEFSGKLDFQESDLKLELNLYFYPTIHNVSVLFLVPVSSKLEFEFLLFDFKGNLLDSQIVSRENMYFFLLFPLAPFFFDDDADERILNEYFGRLGRLMK